MKQKKREKALLKELESIKILKNESVDLQQLENQMAELIKKAAHYYQDQLNQNMSHFYYEYGSILVQRLEDSQEGSENSLNCVEISQNDRELRNTQLAFENLETAKSILRNKLDKQNIEMYRLQEQLTNIRAKIAETQLDLSLCFMRVGDLQCWREEYKDALMNFENAIELLNPNLNIKELSAIHYKIANSLLQQNENGCENQALLHLEKSFRYSYKAIYQKECEIDLSEKKINLVKEENEILKQLLEKLEDTYVQNNEVKQCEIEIEKWKQNQPLLLEKEVVYLGKLTPSANKLGGMQIKRKM